MRSIRLQFFSIIIAILLILLILLNTYPLISSRDLVFREKESGMLSQASVIASSLSGLDSLGAAGVEEVLRLMDVGGYGRVAVADEQGALVYDSGRVPMGYALYYTSGQNAAVELTYGSALPTGGGVTWAQLPGNPATIAGQTASKYITVALVDVVTGKVVAGGNTTMLVKA